MLNLLRTVIVPSALGCHEHHVLNRWPNKVRIRSLKRAACYRLIFFGSLQFPVFDNRGRREWLLSCVPVMRMREAYKG